MLKKMLLFVFIGLASFSDIARADATLKGSLGLSIDQARVVDAIQAEHRPRFAAKRTEQNNQLRVLRRARIANDSLLIASQEKVCEKLHEELRQIRLHEDQEIRKVLTAEQNRKFDDYLKLRKEMVGSSRDAKDF